MGPAQPPPTAPARRSRSARSFAHEHRGGRWARRTRLRFFFRDGSVRRRRTAPRTRRQLVREGGGVRHDCAWGLDSELRTEWRPAIAAFLRPSGAVFATRAQAVLVLPIR